MIVENVVLSNISSIREYERNKESLIRKVKLSVLRGSNWVYNKETGRFDDVDLSSLNGKWVDYNGANTLFDNSRNQYFSTISISEDGKNFKSVAYGLGDMSIDKIKRYNCGCNCNRFIIGLAFFSVVTISIFYILSRKEVEFN